MEGEYGTDRRRSAGIFSAYPGSCHCPRRGFADDFPAGRQPPRFPEDFKKGTGIPIKTYTKWLDYDTIKKGSLVLRHRRPGDYLIINDQGGRKKLKDYFIDEKIERREQDRLWLLADGSHVLGVIGGRMSAACRVTERTEKVLKIHADGGVWNE